MKAVETTITHEAEEAAFYAMCADFDATLATVSRKVRKHWHIENETTGSDQVYESRSEAKRDMANILTPSVHWETAESQYGWRSYELLDRHGVVNTVSIYECTDSDCLHVESPLLSL